MKYKLYIRQYDIATNDYKVREEEIETNDIYHTIGKIYCTSICEIKRIDYQKIDKEKELQQKIENASIFLKEIKEELKSSRYEDDRFYANEHIENIDTTLQLLGEKE